MDAICDWDDCWTDCESVEGIIVDDECFVDGVEGMEEYVTGILFLMGFILKMGAFVAVYDV